MTSLVSLVKADILKINGLNGLYLGIAVLTFRYKKYSTLDYQGFQPIGQQIGNKVE